MLSFNDTAALVLAGGRGLRMNGIDKGLLCLQGKPLVKWCLERLSPQVATVWLSANRNHDIYQSWFDCIVEDKVADNEEGFEGPLAGISACYQCLQASEEIKRLLICPCDTPLIPLDYVARLHQASDDINTVRVAHDGERRQNLHCMMGQQALEQLNDYFLAGGRSMSNWLGTVKAVDVDFSSEKTQFINLNEESDFASLSEKLQ